ncbi:NAD-dependent epimerase/dehydratase family protein [Clavibacter lycopersici]|uniref:NAD-dependent epimerase/dehydratase family protein n=1 Tax=Clavibacter lycopersici TaxID=2301718 RepID=A0A399SYD3_9MICO|nr:NAD-dependent epimerase/dehydratase family protein [Clavibacter lycopersici]RIJ47285.1 NAD-dependent epimerase/dehydratase family protein [Clavibacter lycopersici]RIJ59414.1 NAD-dependent epimerase/dehydratase family protein [Clavibacter lycopersici]
MRAFITGAAGWIGTALTTELVATGHEVRGLVRSDASAERVRRIGATPVRGDMADHDLLVAEALAADATAHLAFTLDFDAFDETVDNEVRLVERIGDALEGTGKAFSAASGTPTSLGQLATEQDELDPAGPAGVRSRTARAVLALSERGIRSGLVRMPRTVHGQGDRNGLIAALVGLDRQLGTAAYVGDGTNRWPAVHITDAGRLFRIALETAPAGSVLHAVGEEGVAMREVAEAIARQTGLTASAVDPEQLGVFGALLGGDQPASNAATRELVDWEPTGPTLLDDIEAGYYTS